MHISQLTNIAVWNFVSSQKASINLLPGRRLDVFWRIIWTKLFTMNIIPVC